MRDITGGRPNVGRCPVPCVPFGVLYKLVVGGSDRQTLVVCVMHGGGVIICIYVVVGKGDLKRSDSAVKTAFLSSEEPPTPAIMTFSGADGTPLLIVVDSGVLCPSFCLNSFFWQSAAFISQIWTASARLKSQLSI